jgi:hypothetical protein
VAYRYATVADVTDASTGVAPEITLSSAQVQVWLDIAQELISLSIFKAKTSQAHALLAAHLISQSPAGGGSGAAGPIVAEANGPASRSFASTVTASDGTLSASAYGQAFLMLRKSVTPLPVRVRSGYP